MSTPALNTTSATPLATLGATYRHATGNGYDEWRYIRNGGANPLTPGMLAIRGPNAGQAEEFVGILLTANVQVSPARALGFAQTAIPAGHYGWVKTRGWGIILPGANIAADTAVKSHAPSGKTGAVQAVAAAVEASVAHTGAALTIDVPGNAFIALPC